MILNDLFQSLPDRDGHDRYEVVARDVRRQSADFGGGRVVAEDVFRRSTLGGVRHRRKS